MTYLLFYRLKLFIVRCQVDQDCALTHTVECQVWVGTCQITHTCTHTHTSDLFIHINVSLLLMFIADLFYTT